ncbi:MAG: phosphoribosylanthranilate isomerase [Gemmatimonadota bacterium]|nr:phosphoribosylanthranilate isomerase [Gemmatimonadota bacterium]
MHASLSVKVCGITEATAAHAAVDAGADYLGLVFAASRRQVDLEAARRLIDQVEARWVGVFVDPDLDRVAELVDRLGLHAVQLHGRESAGSCESLRIACGRPVWKALAWDADEVDVEAYAAATDALLFDTAAGDRLGGTGRTLPWERLAERLPGRPRRPPIFLAGGLGPDNVDRAVRTVDPDGVDASSRLERSPGRKDPDRVDRFVRAARAAERSGPNRATAAAPGEIEEPR